LYLENVIEVRFESLVAEIEKGEEILLKKIDSIEKHIIKKDYSITIFKFKFPRFSKSYCLTIGMLIIDDEEKEIVLELKDELVFRSESEPSYEAIYFDFMQIEDGFKSRFTKSQNNLQHSSFFSYFLT
jgi:hypothetical protein